MSSVTEAVLRELRDERDSWMQARRELEDLQRKANDADQMKVVTGLAAAIQHVQQMETQATLMLEATEDIVNALTPNKG